MGGTMMWTGAWRRPHSYGPDAGAEAQHVHRALGLIDVSTLGKILVTGPDAGAFLDRVYPNRFSDLKVGRTRYGVLTGDAGRIMDDGVVARIDETTFYVSATSTGADGVYQWFTWWNAVWFMDVQFANLTGALAAINVNALLGSLVIIILMLIVPVTLLGCVSPFAIRLAVDDINSAGRISGRIYALSTLGSLFGTYLPVLLIITIVLPFSEFPSYLISSY